MSDLHSICLALSMRRIFIEEVHKSIGQPQTRLNPITKEVMKKEITKWLDAEIIYPISENKWVSPVYCIPKKGGMTMFINEKNELIPTRMVIRWRIYMDYHKLNDTKERSLPVSFID